MTKFRDRSLKLLHNGYRIIPIPARTKRPRLDNWESTKATVDSINRWAANGYAEGNIGLLTADTPGVDLDILDIPFVQEMQQVVAQVVNSTLPIPMRIGRAPKCLMLFCTAEPFTKISSPFFISPDEQKHRVEVLGEGQQFVAFGIHPDTGREFNWITQENPLSTPADELPLITREQAQRIVIEFIKRAKARGWKEVPLGFKGSFDEASSLGSTEPTGIDMRPKLRVTAEDVRDALRLMDGFDDYETWYRVGMGLHHQFDGDAEGLKLWLEWSSQWEQYEEKKGEEAAHYRWENSFTQARDGGHGPITVAFIIKNANNKRREQEEAAFVELQADIESALDFRTLIGPIAKKIATTDLNPVQRDVLSKLIQKRAKRFTGVAVSLKEIAAVTRPGLSDEVLSDKLRFGDELEVQLARRVMRTRFEDGAHIKRVSKNWFTYQDGMWAQEDDEYIERCVLETLTDLRRLDDKTLRELMSRVDESRGDRLNALVSTVTSVMTKLVAEQSKNDPLGFNTFETARVINCKNCEVWIDDNGVVTTQEHNPTHNLTSQLACEYEPDALCPTWDASIRKVFRLYRDPEEAIRHFEEAFGYIMQPSRETALWVLFKGRGGTGKSFLLTIITLIMGHSSVIAQSISEIASRANSHFTSALVGKLMLYDDDLKTHTLLPDDWLKRLSEAKLLTADPKFGQAFEFVARAIPVILTNTWPATSDLSEGLKRRVEVFEANHILREDEIDPNHLRTIIANELPGVLNRFVAGMQRFLTRGARFDPPRECIESKERWLASSNTTVRFISECIEKVPGRHAVRASDLYEHYAQWLRYWEIGARPLGRNKFYEAMDALHLKRVSHGNIVHYTGIRLKLLDTGFHDLDDDGLDV